MGGLDPFQHPAAAAARGASQGGTPPSPRLRRPAARAMDSALFVRSRYLVRTFLQVVGSTDELGAWDGSLGAWDADLSLAMHCHGGDVWLAAAQGIRAGTLEFAFAVVSDDTGEFTWEAPLSGNRVIQVRPPICSPPPHNHSHFYSCREGEKRY